jgi:hypothetical protein
MTTGFGVGVQIWEIQPWQHGFGWMDIIWRCRYGSMVWGVYINANTWPCQHGVWWMRRGGRCSHCSMCGVHAQRWEMQPSQHGLGEWAEIGDAVMTGMQPWQQGVRVNVHMWYDAATTTQCVVDGQRCELQHGRIVCGGCADIGDAAIAAVQPWPQGLLMDGRR